MRAGVTTSVIAHSAVLLIALVGLGSAKPLTPDVVESIAVDLVPISDITNIRAGSLDSKVVKTDTPAIVETQKVAELAKPTGNTEDDQVTPTPADKSTPAPVMNTAPKPQPAPDPKPDPQPVKTPDPTPPPQAAPDPAPTPDPAPPDQQVATDKPTDAPAEAVAPMPAPARPAVLQKAPVKAPPTPTKTVTPTPKTPVTPPKDATPVKQPDDKAAKIADQVADLINSEKSRGAVTGDGGSPTLGKDTGKAATLSQSALDGLVAQIKGCMNVPAGAQDANVTATLHFTLDAQGNVMRMPDILSDTSDPLTRSFASAAQRAVMRCGPYAMAVGQEIQAVFTPNDT